jgi:hypothetical protein
VIVEQEARRIVVNITTNTADGETPDYEKIQRVDLSIIAKDTNTTDGFPDTITAVLSVVITNLNDEAPVLEDATGIIVEETADADQNAEENYLKIYTFRATDADLIVGDLTFSIR